MQPWKPGRILGGKYRLLEPLGAGGMGSVWKAEHLTLHSPIAIKLIHPSLAVGTQAVERFLREARAAAALRSPHVVQILDYGVDGDTPYMAMEALEGESLGDRLARTERLSVLETARVIRHVSRAIGRAHDAGMVHRDLKPENIFIVHNDDEELIKVLDFGIVKASARNDGSPSPHGTHAGVLLGTPSFMSPEQLEGRESVDLRSDIWALGVVAFKCLVGQLPFRGDTIVRLILEVCSQRLPVPSELGPVPPGFDAWFATACARDPGARFESAKQAADMFERIDAVRWAGRASREAPVSAPRVPPNDSPQADTTTALLSDAQRPRRPAQRRRRLHRLFAVVAVLGLASAGGIFWELIDWRGRAKPSPPAQDSAALLKPEPAVAGRPSPEALGPRRATSHAPPPVALETAPSPHRIPRRARAVPSATSSPRPPAREPQPAALQGDAPAAGSGARPRRTAPSPQRSSRPATAPAREPRPSRAESAPAVDLGI